MKYRLEYTARARKDLHRSGQKTAQRIIRALHSLTGDPYSRVKKLQGTSQPFYSFHIGLAHRAILTIQDAVLVVLILEIEDRKKEDRDS